jgi:Cyclic nucleotide-binding domain
VWGVGWNGSTHLDGLAGLGGKPLLPSPCALQHLLAAQPRRHRPRDRDGLFLFGADRPLWVGIGWNFVFIGTNAIQLGLLVRERLRVRFSEQERLLHRGVFSELTPIDFSRLLKAGEWRDVDEGTVLARENAPITDVSVLIAGAAKVEVGGKLVALLQPGALIGEMSFLTRSNASADVTTAAPSRLFSIAKPKLEALFQSNAGIETAIHRLMGQDLVRKLLSASH